GEVARVRLGGLRGAAAACLPVTVLAIAVLDPALQLGAWSEVHYGAFSRNLWGSLDHFYRIVGIYAIAFALWWLLRGENWKTARGRKRS
ncbi:MAG: hypothetical protein KY432_10065, partial [Acidobacteria bacterium]|nr:hypothetical protein [Acidobacteriota bacterium]